MERLTGWLYERNSSSRSKAILDVDANGRTSIDGVVLGAWRAIQVSDRIGNVPRRLTLQDGRVLETLDNDAVDRLEIRFQGQASARILHRLESRWRWAAAALAATILLGWLTIAYGIPLAANRLAFALPQTLLAMASQQTLEAFDQLAFHPSKLEEKRQSEIEALLLRAAKAADSDYDYRLVLRDGGKIGANAFALPDGAIVMTDQLVDLAENDLQILAVIAHEIGHVERRHGMQRMVQSSAMAAVALFVLGDVSQVLAALPAMLLESAYSRDFEREADLFAVALMRELSLPPAHLADFLERMEKEDGQASVPGWLSTHPPTPERLRLIREAEMPPRP
ncbi:Peptidase M48 Ste24p [Rhodospirillaceae bacterium LM-1]|nr:Peptidase M48 Ste24p [Rhodospirillaceae bacterium LM-1]